MKRGGGIGYLAAVRATELVIEKAESNGVAAASTHNHGHAGSMGIYARMALRKSLVTFSFSGASRWRPPEEPNATVWESFRAPAMCISIPAASGPPLVIDFSTNMFPFRNPEGLADAIQRYPDAVFKSMGLKFAAEIISGILAGTMLSSQQREDHSRPYGGFLIVAFQPDALGNGEAFEKDVAYTIAGSLALPPLPGMDSTEVAGSLEWKHEREWAMEGIPVGKQHRELLEGIAGELGVKVPW